MQFFVVYCYSLKWEQRAGGQGAMKEINYVSSIRKQGKMRGMI